MSIHVEVPHKVLFCGSYTVLEGYPALAFAIEPRMSLQLTRQDAFPWPRHNPFALAVREVLGEYIQQYRPDLRTESSPWWQFQTSVSAPIEGWGVGSSAAFTSALMFAQAEAWDLQLPLSILCQMARVAHRKAQGGRGSGIDVATCCFGGVVLASQCQSDAPPVLRSVPWPSHIGFVLIRSGQKADTRRLIQLYQESVKGDPVPSRRGLLRSVGAVCRSLQESPVDFLPALQENCICERHWSQELGISLVTAYQAQLEQALQDWISRQMLVVKALGAGGGDSIGLFYRADQLRISDLLVPLRDIPLQARPTRIETHGLVRLGSWPGEQVAAENTYLPPDDRIPPLGGPE